MTCRSKGDCHADTWGREFQTKIAASTITLSGEHAWYISVISRETSVCVELTRGTAKEDGIRKLTGN